MAWFKHQKNTTKLIKFIIAIKDEYNKLATNYNQLEMEQDKLLTRDKLLTEKQGVIYYLRGQVADFTAENDIFRQLQK